MKLVNGNKKFGTLEFFQIMTYRRYPTPEGWVATLAKEDLLLPDPEPLDSGVPEPDIIKSLSLRMTQAMNHYQQEESHCFVCGATDHFAQDCPH